METAGYVCLNRWYTHESVKAEAKRKLIYLLLQLCQQRDGVAEEFSLQRSSAPGHFYRLLLPLYPHRREVSWRGFFWGFSRTSCSGFYSAFCFTFLKEPTSNLWRIPQRIQEEGFCVLNSLQCSIRCGTARSGQVFWRLFYAALLRSSGTKQSRFLPLLNHYLLIHFTQPGVIMHGPVNGYLSMLRIYLIISRSGGEDKSADCVHCGAFSAGGERLKWEQPGSVWEWVSSAKPVWRQSMEISQR